MHIIVASLSKQHLIKGNLNVEFLKVSAASFFYVSFIYVYTALFHSCLCSVREEEARAFGGVREKICSQLKRYNAIPCYYGERKKKKKIRGSKIRVLRLRWSQVFHFVPPFNYAKFHLTPCSLTPCWFNFALIASNFRDRVRYSTRGHKKSVKVMWQ